MNGPSSNRDEAEARYWRIVAYCIRARRTEKGWTQGMMARQAGLSRSCIQYIENGGRHPNHGTLSRLCQAWGISLSEFTGSPIGSPPSGPRTAADQIRPQAHNCGMAKKARLVLQ